MALVIIADDWDEDLILLAERRKLSMYNCNSENVDDYLKKIKKNMSRVNDFLDTLGVPKDSYGFENIEKLFINSNAFNGIRCDFMPTAVTVTKVSANILERCMLVAKASAFYNNTDLFRKIYGKRANVDISNTDFFLRAIIYYNTFYNK